MGDTKTDTGEVMFGIFLKIFLENKSVCVYNKNNSVIKAE
jgi:hypothetical protein